MYKKDKKDKIPIKQRNFCFHNKEYSMCDLLALLSLTLLIISDIVAVIYLCYCNNIDIFDFIIFGWIFVFWGFWCIVAYPIIPLIPVIIIAFALYIKALSLNGYRRNSLQEKIRKICKVTWSIILVQIILGIFLVLLLLPFS